MNYTNSFMTKIYEISELCTNPERGRLVMKHVMKAAIQLEHARYVFDLFVDLKRRHIGTTEIESMSKRICFKLPSKRCRTLSGYYYEVEN